MFPFHFQESFTFPFFKKFLLSFSPNFQSFYFQAFYFPLQEFFLFVFWKFLFVCCCFFCFFLLSEFCPFIFSFSFFWKKKERHFNVIVEVSTSLTVLNWNFKERLQATFKFNFEHFLSGNISFLEKTTFHNFKRQPLHFTQSSLTTLSTKDNSIKDNVVLQKQISLDTGPKLNAYKTFKKRPGRLFWMPSVLSINVPCSGGLQRTKATNISP